MRAATPATPTTPRHGDVSSGTYRSSVTSFSSTMWQLPRTPSPDPQLGVASSSRLMLPSATASCFNIPNNLSELLDYSPSCSPAPSLPPSPTGSFTLRTNSSSTLSCSPSDATLPSGPLTPPDSESGEWDNNRYCDSPPPLPPKSIQDQMQDAYALDNMHLAKVLLLKLRGIEVTSDDDPRIAQIKDVDFSDAFVPPGGLQLSPEDEERYQEGLRREREHRRRVQREARLRACERVWESSVRCFREERNKVTRRKEEVMKERRRMEIEARGREREAREREIERQADTLARYTRQLKVSTCSNQRTRLSYGSLPVSSTRSALLKATPSPAPTFKYAIMPPVHTLTSARHTISPPSSPPKGKSPLDSPHRALKELTAMSEQRVPFGTVVMRMHGPLFPEDDEDNDRDGVSGSLGSSGSGSVRRLLVQRRTATQIQLFEELLKRDVSRWEERTSPSTSPTTRPKVVAVPRRKTSAECPACSLSLASAETFAPKPDPSTASTSSSHTLAATSSTRPNSWFSSISSILSTPSLTSSSSISSTESALPSTPISSPTLPRATTSKPNTSQSSAKPPAIPSSSIPTSPTLTRFVHTHHTCEHSKFVPLSSTDVHPLSPSSPSPLGHSIVPPSPQSHPQSRPRGRPLTRTSTLTSILTVKPTHPSSLGITAVRSSSSPSPTPTTQGEREGEGLVWKMSKGLSRFVEMAAQFQRAYVKATMFSAGSDLYSERDWGFADPSVSRSYSRSRTRTRSRVRSEEDVWARRGRTRERRGLKLRPEGYRVTSIDVQTFLSDSLVGDPTPNRPLLPLNTLSSSASSSNSRPLRFPHPPSIPRSPFRSEPPPHELTQRFRPIANPLLLRMRAVQNLVCARAGVRLEDANLREKVVGVAWDGIGRSGLGWEVSCR